MFDDTIRQAIHTVVRRGVERALDELEAAAVAGADLGVREQQLWAQLRQVGCAVLELSLAYEGTTAAEPRLACPCGAAATVEHYRGKDVQTLLGWLRLPRASYHCPSCGQRQVPFDRVLGLSRATHSPTVRERASEFGARLPFAAAAELLARATGIRLGVSTVRTLTEALGSALEQALATAVDAAWQEGLPLRAVPGPDRLYVAMDGVQILTTDGSGKEAKVGVLAAETRPAPDTGQRGPARYVASFAGATAFGQRLALAAHEHGVERAGEVIVLGDGAEWIWNLAREHFPSATHIVDWYHASERIWELGRALYGDQEHRVRRWVARQLALLEQGAVARLVQGWRRRRLRGLAAAARDEQVTYFTNQASRMAYEQYRARGLDIGSGMVESGCKYLIGAREKGPGMRWSVAGAQAVANVRLLLFNDEWDPFWHPEPAAA